MNTWMWPVDHELYYQVFSGFMGSLLGKWLIKRYNFFLNVIVRIVIGQKQKFPREIFEHYRKPIEKPEERKGNWTLPGQIVGASSWLLELWEKRDLIKDKPSFLFWGMQDLGFREKELKVWEHFLTNKLVIRLDKAGHFPHEEEAEKIIEALKKWMSPT
jgi:haloalkane dehalogenase